MYVHVCLWINCLVIKRQFKLTHKCTHFKRKDILTNISNAVNWRISLNKEQKNLGKTFSNWQIMYFYNSSIMKRVMKETKTDVLHYFSPKLSVWLFVFVCLNQVAPSLGLKNCSSLSHKWPPTSQQEPAHTRAHARAHAHTHTHVM